MDQTSINEAVRQAVRRCLESNEPLVALKSFLDRMRGADWTESDISKVSNAATRILAIIYEPQSAENAHDGEQRDRKQPTKS